jgi:glyoxylate utilization-related uncharacterized protein
VESLAEVLSKPMPRAQVGVFMVWHSVGLERMWNLPAGHMKALIWAQVLVEVVQNKPVVAVQSVVPHWQSVPAMLVVTPLVTGQVADGRFEQVLVEAVQYIPVVVVQSVVPHWQSVPAVLVVAPLQSVGDTHEFRQQSAATQILAAQLADDKSFFKD